MNNVDQAIARNRGMFLTGLTLILLCAAIFMAVIPARGASASTALAIDVACNANSFVFAGPSNAAGPDYGASFVVQGVIYPAGTLAPGSSQGLTAEGQPEFPDLVIGTWTCRGWFIGDGLATTSGPFVATTQIYDLDPLHPGEQTLVTNGIELIDLNVPFARAITGGTGRLVRARGELIQTAIGENATGLFNFRFEGNF